MKHLTYAERAFLHAHLSRVRHVTLDPDGPGVCAHPPDPLPAAPTAKRRLWRS